MGTYPDYLFRAAPIVQQYLIDNGHRDIVEWVEVRQKLFLCWELIVGIPLASKTFPARVERKTLIILVEDANYSHHLKYYQRKILGDIERICGEGKVKKIIFRVGEIPIFVGWREKLLLHWPKVVGENCTFYTTPLKVEEQNLTIIVEEDRHLQLLENGKSKVLNNISAIIGRGLIHDLEFLLAPVAEGIILQQKLLAKWKSIVGDNFGTKSAPLYFQKSCLTVLVEGKLHTPFFPKYRKQVVDYIRHFFGTVKIKDVDFRFGTLPRYRPIKRSLKKIPKNLPNSPEEKQVKSSTEQIQDPHIREIFSRMMSNRLHRSKKS